MNEGYEPLTPGLLELLESQTRGLKPGRKLTIEEAMERMRITVAGWKQSEEGTEKAEVDDEDLAIDGETGSVPMELSRAKGLIEARRKRPPAPPSDMFID